MFKEQSIRNKMIEDIKSIYRHKFIEITGISKVCFQNRASFHKILILLQKKKFKVYRWENDILWLTFEFPPQFSAEILDNFSFVLNAFPIYNRGWKKQNTVLISWEIIFLW
jgi:hypothetical protein